MPSIAWQTRSGWLLSCPTPPSTASRPLRPCASSALPRYECEAMTSSPRPSGGQPSASVDAPISRLPGPAASHLTSCCDALSQSRPRPTASQRPNWLDCQLAPGSRNSEEPSAGREAGGRLTAQMRRMLVKHSAQDADFRQRERDHRRHDEPSDPPLTTRRAGRSSCDPGRARSRRPWEVPNLRPPAWP